MIDIKETGDTNQLEMSLSGQVTQADYDTVLIPAIETLLGDHDTMRVMVVIEEEFTGYDVAAMWADSKLGLTYWRGFDRLAVAVDKGWIATAVRAFAPLMPCPVRVFPLAEADAARRWLRESLGAVHIRDLGGPSLQVELLGRPDESDFNEASGDLDARLRERDGFRLLLDLREFDGWQGLSAIAGHFTLAREHASLVQRAAIVGEHGWQKLGQRIAGWFLNGETRYFPGSEFEAAKAWLTGD